MGWVLAPGPIADPAFVKRSRGQRNCVIVPLMWPNPPRGIQGTDAILIEALGLYQEKEEKVYDSIIVGAGAAGLTTSIYAQRDRFSTLILEKRNIGGNAYLTEKIENYPEIRDETKTSIEHYFETDTRPRLL